MVSYYFVSDCLDSVIWFDFYTIFKKIGFYKTVFGSTLAVELMSVAF